MESNTWDRLPCGRCRRKQTVDQGASQRALLSRRSLQSAVSNRCCDSKLGFVNVPVQQARIVIFAKFNQNDFTKKDRNSKNVRALRVTAS
jgi:hypothetical protein